MDDIGPIYENYLGKFSNRVICCFRFQGWVRYQEDDRMTPAPYIGPPGPPGHHGPPGMYPPPGMAPHNMMYVLQKHSTETLHYINIVFFLILDFIILLHY